MSGAIDLDACTTRRKNGLCRCEPKCKECDFGPHVAIHGPFRGQPPGSKPYGHEYVPNQGEELPINTGQEGNAMSCYAIANS